MLSEVLCVVPACQSGWGGGEFNLKIKQQKHFRGGGGGGGGGGEEGGGCGVWAGGGMGRGGGRRNGGQGEKITVGDDWKH